LSALYLAATSFYPGPTNLLSTAWQAKQFFSLANSALANTLFEASALIAITNNAIRFISLSLFQKTAKYYLVFMPDLAISGYHRLKKA
jgi:hypothetical protein